MEERVKKTCKCGMEYDFVVKAISVDCPCGESIHKIAYTQIGDTPPKSAIERARELEKKVDCGMPVDYAETRDMIAAYEQAYRELEEDHEVRMAVNIGLQNQLTEKEQRIIDLEDEVYHLRRGDLAAKDREIERLKEKIDGLKREVERYVKTAEGCYSVQMKYAEGIGARDRKIDALHDQLTEKEKRIAELEDLCGKQRDQLVREWKEIKYMRREIRALQNNKP